MHKYKVMHKNVHKLCFSTVPFNILLLFDLFSESHVSGKYYYLHVVSSLENITKPGSIAQLQMSQGLSLRGINEAKPKAITLLSII